MYRVIKYFTDLHDNNHPYSVGDAFPRKGIKVMEKRLAELAGSENRQGVPLIELVDEVAESTEGIEKQEAEKATVTKKTGTKKTTAKKAGVKASGK